MKKIKLKWLMFCICIFTVFVYPQEYTDYSGIDAYVDETPGSVEENIASLAKFLTKTSSNDFEKIRALFRWITMNIDYDVQSYFNRDHKQIAPEHVLKQKLAVCDGYAHLLANLGKTAGLEIVVIYGYSKGYGYKTGDQLAGGVNHAWNAVKINGQWYLIDATWGAGHIDDSKKFIRKFQDHYFLTPPEKFIYDHFPQEERWQLIDHPVSLREFQDMLNLQPAFFEHGLAIKSHHENTILANRDLKIDIFAPDHVAIIGQLERRGNELPEYLTFSQRKSGVYSIYSQFPDDGQYLLKIYVKGNETTGEYAYATEYKIEVDQVHPDAGFPTTYSPFYDTNAYLFEPMQRNLKSGKIQPFKVFVPGAFEIVIKNAEQWYPLKKQGQLFAGDIPLIKGKVGLYAKFSDSNKFDGILEWYCD